MKTEEIIKLINDYLEKEIFDAPIYWYDSEISHKKECISFEYFGLNVEHYDAKELGVTLTYSDRWHGYSDIRSDEIRDTEIAVLKKAFEPLINKIKALDE